jgi:hypothetical protein
MTALVGEVLERRDGRWRTVHLGNAIPVRDRRRVNPDRWAWDRKDVDPLAAATLATWAFAP